MIPTNNCGPKKRIFKLENTLQSGFAGNVLVKFFFFFGFAVSYSAKPNANAKRETQKSSVQSAASNFNSSRHNPGFLRELLRISLQIEPESPFVAPPPSGGGGIES